MQVHSNDQEILNKIWDKRNHILLISTLNKIEVLTDYIDLTQLIKLLRSGGSLLDVSFGHINEGLVMKIRGPQQVYGITHTRQGLYKGRVIHFLGNIITYDAPDDIKLAEHIAASAALLRLLPTKS